MAVTAHPYTNYLLDLLMGRHDCYSDALFMALLTDQYQPNIYADWNFSSIQGSETTGTGYTAGGREITDKNVDLDTTDGNRGRITAPTLVWPLLTATFRYAVLYNPSQGNNLIGYVDFGENVASDGIDFAMEFPDGLLSIRQG